MEGGNRSLGPVQKLSNSEELPLIGFSFQLAIIAYPLSVTYYDIAPEAKIIDPETLFLLKQQV